MKKMWTSSILAAYAVMGSVGSSAAGDYFLASGRWDNVVLVIDLNAAIDPANDGTSNAIVNRLRVTPDIDTDKDGTADAIASGQPIIVTIAPDQKKAYISNHSGKVTEEEASAFQHGHPGSVTVVDLTKALDPTLNETLGAVETWIDSEGSGATGFAILPMGTHAALAHAESSGHEDGGRHIKIVDLTANKVTGAVELALGEPGFDCPPETIPYKAPDPNFGCFPDTNGVTATPAGGGLIFTANGGTNDISVIDIEKALAGDKRAEIGRIPMQSGGFGITTSPDGRYVAHASRENAQDGVEGNTVSIIDAKLAANDPANAEIARVLVGTNDPDEGTRPFVAAFTPDGTRIVSTNFRTNSIDVINVQNAVNGLPAIEARISLTITNGDPSRPRGIAFTPDGKYAAITGAPPKAGHNSSMVWIVDMETLEAVGRVTEVGSESYMIGHFSSE